MEAIQVVAVKITTAAAMMDVSIEKVRALIETGKLRAYGRGMGLRVYVDSLRPYVHSAMIPTIEQKKKRIRAKSKPKGYIYLIKSGRYYKIGLTTNLEQRIRTFKTTIPGDIELVHSIPSDDLAKAELYLHEEFKHRRVNGEWFLLTKTDVAAIKRYGFL